MTNDSAALLLIVHIGFHMFNFYTFDELGLMATACSQMP